MKFLMMTLLLSFVSLSIVASETDNFTLKTFNFADSTQWLNKKMNSSLDEVAASTKSCEPYELQQKLFQSLGGVFVANIEKWSETNPNAIFLPIDKSIYSEVTGVRGSHGARKLVKFKSYYTPGQFKVGDVILGDDKLGHFLQLGYGMYYAVNWKKDHQFKDIRNRMQQLAEVAAHDYKFIRNSSEVTPDDIVAAFATFQEDGEWGMTATLVKSYGDMAADYSGYLFWSELTEGRNPYYKCENNHFKLVRTFNWNEYINSSWDESINCSEFHPSIEQSVLDQIEKRGFGPCPIKPESCAQLVKSLGPLAAKLLHPQCFLAGKSLL